MLLTWYVEADVLLYFHFASKTASDDSICYINSFSLDSSIPTQLQVVLDNPTTFKNPFQFEITFECLQELEDDLEWKVLYVGSAHDASKDQTLDEILVGPIPVGVNKFVLQADAPDPNQLPPDELLGVTVVLVTCSYREREFLRVGYYVNNEYVDPNGPPPVQLDEKGEPLPLPPPPKYPQLDLNHVQRQILADKPRVTKFAIPWTEEDVKQAEAKAAAAAAANASSPDADTSMTQEDAGTPTLGSEAPASGMVAATGGAAPMEM